MATLIAKANGNWTASTTWGVAEAGSGAILVTRSASTNSTTSYVWSSAFTCTNEDVIQGILLHIKALGATGTFTVGLSADNGSSAAAEVTVNVSDIPTDQCWMFFSFGASPVTADGGSDYKVGIKSSTNAMVTVYRDGTAGNWARVLRTTAEAAPNTGDALLIAKEWTGAATGTARSVTMDAVAGSIVDYGTLDIGQGGTLTYGSSASTAYYLRLSGDCNVWSGGTLNMGTVGTPIPATSTAVLNLDCGSNVQYGLLVNNGGTFVAQGASKTVSCLLAADASANATSLTTNVATSWADNDGIAIASTTRTAGQCEAGSLNGAASGTTLTVDGFGGVGGGVQFAHSGTNDAVGGIDTRAEIINITRNVQICGAAADKQSYLLVSSGASVDLDYTEFYWLGSNTANKRGLDIQTTTAGACNIQYCALRNFAVTGSGIILSGSALDGVVFSHNVTWSMAVVAFSVAATSGTWTAEGNVFMYITQNANIVVLSDVGGTFKDNTVIGSPNGNGIQLGEAAALGTFTGNSVHSNSAIGITVTTAPTSGTLSFRAWRNTTSGLGSAVLLRRLTLSDCIMFGNSPNISLNGDVDGLTLNNVRSNADAAFATASGLHLGGSFHLIQMNNCSFGVAAGSAVAHTQDVNIQSGNSLVQIVARDSVFSSSTLVTNLDSAASPSSYFASQRDDGTAGSHITRRPLGTDGTDSGVYRTAAPSERLTPSNATLKLESGPIRKAVDNGATATFTVYVRKSVAGDGAAYNGSQPRLILKANPAVGIDADVVLDTATAVSDGDWEALTGTSAAVDDDGVLEALVDCDGTAGWINVDDWS